MLGRATHAGGHPGLYYTHWTTHSVLHHKIHITVSSAPRVHALCRVCSATPRSEARSSFSKLSLMTERARS